MLLEYGCKVTLIDNMSNSFPRVFDHMKKLAGDKADLMKFVKVRLIRFHRSITRDAAQSSCQCATRSHSKFTLPCTPQCDINDKELLDKLFTEEKYDCVIHFAGFKAVGESVEKPLEVSGAV